MTADKKYIPYIRDKSRTKVSVDRMLSLRLRKIRSKKFLMFIEKDLTLDIIRYPINPKEMYCESCRKVSLTWSFKIHKMKFKHLVIGSVLSFLPLAIFQAVSMNLVME